MVSNLKKPRGRVVEGLTPVVRVNTQPEDIVYYDPETEFFYVIMWREDGQIKSRMNIADMEAGWIQETLKDIWDLHVYDKALAYELGQRFRATIIVEEL